MLIQEEVAETALTTLHRYPYLDQRVPDDIIRQSLESTWPDPPAPLIYWLWVAGADVVDHQAAEVCVESLERILAMLQNSDIVRGAWPSRIGKLIPPRRRATFDHLAEFRSSLFELIAAYRLIAKDTKVVLESDGGPPGCDLTVVFRSKPLLGVEVYAPQKGARDWYEETIAQPWRALVGDTVSVEAITGVQDISLLDAASQALRNVLTDSNFQRQKAKQLAAGELPTLLMIRGYGLTKRLEEIVTTPTATELARRLGKEAWSCLPQQCGGIVLGFLGDVVQDVIRRQSPTMFVPAPNRVLADEVWEYLRRTGTLTRDLLRARGVDRAES